MQRIVPFLSKISASFNFDILWRLIRFLPSDERCFLLWRLVNDEAEQITFRRQDILWTVYTSDLGIGLSLFRDGDHQLREFQALLAWMRNHGRLAPVYKTIIEVGANIGTSTIPLALHTNCHIYAIEPAPQNFHLLQHNVHQNGQDSRINCLQCAVFSHSETLQFLYLPRSGGGGMVAPPVLNGEPPGRTDTGELLEVPAKTLSRLIVSCEISPAQVAFVWSDTEGSEAHVIETGQELWVAGVPLYVEFYPDVLRKQRSLQNFLDLANRHFVQFVDIRDILAQGVNAFRRPIADLRFLIEDLEKNDIMVTDIILMPRSTPN